MRVSYGGGHDRRDDTEYKSQPARLTQDSTNSKNLRISRFSLTGPNCNIDNCLVWARERADDVLL